MTDYTRVFYTVPLHGTEMTRDDKGSKIGGAFPTPEEGGWMHYTKERNLSNNPLLAAIPLKEFIGIDFDLIDSYNEALTLIPTPAYRADSLPKELGKGGHLLYRHTDLAYNELKQLRALLKKQHKIDIQVDNSLIYLATPANKTKELVSTPITSLDDLQEVPKILLYYLKSLVTTEAIELSARGQQTSTKAFDMQVFGRLLANGITTTTVHYLTPKDFPNVRHPNDVEQGAGTEWLLQIRKKLQADSTVSQDTFIKTIKALNAMWDDPMPDDRIDRDLHRDLNATEWKYDPEWQKKQAIYTTGRGTTVEAIFVPDTAEWLLLDHMTLDVSRYQSFSNFKDALISLTGVDANKRSLLAKSTKCKIVNSPKYKPFLSIISPTELPIFNFFNPTEGVNILRDPSSFNLEYKEPAHVLKFLENLVPDKDTRDRLIKFIAYKYYTYNYSPLYFVMQGVGGAGKGVFLQYILSYFSGTRMTSATVQTLELHFNSQLAASDWLEIDEGTEGIGETARKKLVASLKRITGSPFINITAKGKDSNMVEHFVTPILFSNLTTKLITDTPENDRRMVVLRAPNKMTEITSDTGEYIDAMKKEMPHFAMYLHNLHTNQPLSASDYTSNNNWKGSDYKDYIEATITTHDKLYSAISNRDLTKFIEVLEDIGVPYSEIESLFFTDTKDSICLYHTSVTRQLSLFALEDIYSMYPTFRTVSVRNEYMALRNSIKYRLHDKSFTYQGIFFSEKFTAKKETIGKISL